MNIEIQDLYDYFAAVLPAPTESKIDDPYGVHWYPEIDQWCENTFGRSDIWGLAPVTGWKRMLNKYYFTSEGLRELFVLRWT